MDFGIFQWSGENPSAAILGILMVTVMAIVLLTIMWLWEQQKHDRWEKRIVQKRMDDLESQLRDMTDARNALEQTMNLRITRLEETVRKQHETIEKLEKSNKEKDATIDQKDAVINAVTTRAMIAEARLEEADKARQQQSVINFTARLVMPDGREIYPIQEEIGTNEPGTNQQITA